MNNIVEFPQPKNDRLRKAIDLLGHHTADLALAEFVRLIDQGCDEAFSYAGHIYECGGRNVDRDHEKARFYYERSIERVGSVAAYLGLIRIYYRGLGVERDFCKALKYCKILSEDADHPYANFYIGKMYMEGNCVSQDFDQAKVYFKKAWDGGYVFGLGYLGIAEQKSGRWLRGFWYRVRAGFVAYGIARRNIKDARIREL
ncbi:MAG: tetratricopeptide repeat protein [Pseudomonadota bacterium]